MYQIIERKSPEGDPAWDVFLDGALVLEGVHQRPVLEEYNGEMTARVADKNGGRDIVYVIGAAK